MAETAVETPESKSEVLPPQNPAHRLEKFKWQSGQSGNPKGRPKGARVKFSEEFYEDIADVWKRKGKRVLDVLADEQPEVLFAGVVKLQPRLLTVNDEREPLNEEQRAASLLAGLRALHQGGALLPILERLGGVGGANNADSGVLEAGQIIDVSPLPEAG